jgi:hypothetical protein
MTTKSEEERLAVVENQITTIQSDVTEIKSDVKSLVATQTQLAIALAVKDAAESQHAKDRASTGVWARWLLPILLTIGNGALTVANFLRGPH